MSAERRQVDVFGQLSFELCAAQENKPPPGGAKQEGHTAAIPTLMPIRTSAHKGKRGRKLLPPAPLSGFGSQQGAPA